MDRRESAKYEVSENAFPFYLTYVEVKYILNGISINRFLLHNKAFFFIYSQKLEARCTSFVYE